MVINIRDYITHEFTHVRGYRGTYHYREKVLMVIVILISPTLLSPNCNIYYSGLGQVYLFIKVEAVESQVPSGALFVFLKVLM